MSALHGLDHSHDGMVLGWAVESLAEFTSAWAESLGGTPDHDDLCSLADGHSLCAFANNAVLRRPTSPSDLAAIDARMRAGFTGDGGPACVWSPWPTPDLTGIGATSGGHPPVMFRPVGGHVPDITRGIDIVEASNQATLADAELVLALGFPLPELAGAPANSVLTKALLDHPVRVFVGYADGEPVATASVGLHHEVNLVEAVAVLPDHRGKGFGEAVTWMATMADPAKPALLESSDLGRPIYARMGFVALFRMSLWVFPRTA